MPLRLHLKPGRHIPVLRGHPWVLSGAVARAEGDTADDEAEIVAADGTVLGRATHHPTSEIRARCFATDPAARLDAPGIRSRLAAALERRTRWAPTAPDGAVRLVFSESDGLPGLIVDRYADVLVVQFLTAPLEARRALVLEALVALAHPRSIYERSDVDARRLEGLEPRQGLLWGEALSGPVRFVEGPWLFVADVEHGHKTGFYLDQRESRRRLADWVRTLGAPRVLNVFAYSDAFGVCALSSGAAEVLSLDSSAAAAALAETHHALNPVPAGGAWRWCAGDAFATLRALREAGESFDLVVLDPPRLVSRRSHLREGLRGYKDLNLLAFHLLRPAGLLFTFSCSGLVDRELFAKVLEGAARDARRCPRVLELLGLPPDHPRPPRFPEADYLKGFVLGL